MFHADGPASFQKGFIKMMIKYTGDLPRQRYIRELRDDPRKALCKMNLTFCNAVLVDVCESLFNALKTWTGGKGRSPSTLLMAVLRIVEGCRQMILKPYLMSIKSTAAKTVRESDPTVMMNLFRYLSRRLTYKATTMMYKNISKFWFQLQVDEGEDGEIIVTGNSNMFVHYDSDIV